MKAKHRHDMEESLKYYQEYDIEHYSHMQWEDGEEREWITESGVFTEEAYKRLKKRGRE